MKKEIKVAGNSIVGRSHLKRGTICQDSSSGIGGIDRGIVVVADGAGSKSHSHIGSKVIAEELEGYILSNFNDLYEGEYLESRDRIIDHISSRLEDESKKIGVEFTDLASTMLFVAIEKGRYIYGHVGDGMIACLKEGIIKVASKPENGEFANQTFFVHPKLKNKLRLGKGEIDNIEGFILMTDGGEAGLYNRGREEAVDANGEIIRWLKNNTEAKVTNLLGELLTKRLRKVTSDDCTLAAMYIKDYRPLSYERKGGGKNIYNTIKRRGLKVRREE